ncbi:MAG: hypothetical protein V8T45_00135 [Oscillospiraceae bacterium]
MRASWFETRDWLEEHCAEYGFIQHFPEGKLDVTGGTIGTVFRYVGEPVAEYMNEQNLCLEEYVMAAGGFEEKDVQAQSAVTAEVLGAYSSRESIYAMLTSPR